ncbi:DinB family protein [Maribacter aquimaris]|uniref:DinB family protein n=1 Tax=Maribacter aquimaris TaxID=2737171 RepID=UPI0037422807
MKTNIGLLTLLMVVTVNAQEMKPKEVPYASIPEAPTTYSAGGVVSRMIDGLGFRYYWATEGLTEGNMDYRPSEKGRNIAETMEHVYGLSVLILNSAQKVPNDRTVEKEKPSRHELRVQTLINLKTASNLFKTSEDLSAHKIVYKNKKGLTEFPFWYQINGPIEDAVWHAGQIVMMRRSDGNPFNAKVNMFTGQVRE